MKKTIISIVVLLVLISSVSALTCGMSLGQPDQHIEFTRSVGGFYVYPYAWCSSGIVDGQSVYVKGVDVSFELDFDETPLRIYNEGIYTMKSGEYRKTRVYVRRVKKGETKLRYCVYPTSFGDGQVGIRTGACGFVTIVR